MESTQQVGHASAPGTDMTHMSCFKVYGCSHGADMFWHLGRTLTVFKQLASCERPGTFLGLALCTAELCSAWQVGLCLAL